MVEITEIADAFVQLLCTFPPHRTSRAGSPAHIYPLGPWSRVVGSLAQISTTLPAVFEPRASERSCSAAESQSPISSILMAGAAISSAVKMDEPRWRFTASIICGHRNRGCTLILGSR